MREARIILPIADNDNESLATVHRELKRQLCTRFGGCTALDVHGAWISDDGTLYDEPGVAYDVAMAPTEENGRAVLNIAKSIGQLANQIAMYVRLASGDVHIVNVKESAAAE
jgi:hypothetical protein